MADFSNPDVPPRPGAAPHVPHGSRAGLLPEADSGPDMGRIGLMAGAGLGALFLLKKLFGSGSDDTHRPLPVQHRELTDGYVDTLTRALEHRLEAGAGLAEAVGETLRQRAPLLLHAPRSDDDGGSSSFWGVLIGLGLLGAAAYGADRAARELTGAGLLDLARSQAGGAPDRPGYDIDRTYPPVHGTAGAEMPTPRTAPPAAPTGPAHPSPPTTAAPTPPAASERPSVHGTPGAEMPATPSGGNPASGEGPPAGDPADYPKAARPEDAPPSPDDEPRRSDQG